MFRDIFALSLLLSFYVSDFILPLISHVLSELTVKTLNWSQFANFKKELPLRRRMRDRERREEITTAKKDEEKSEALSF